MEFTVSAIGRAQRLRALDRANRVRSARAETKRRIAHGELTASEAILSHRWEIASMPVAEVLISQRRWGAQRCQQFLIGIAMNEKKTIGSMTERQRIAAAALLTGGEPTTGEPTTRPSQRAQWQ